MILRRVRDLLREMGAATESQLNAELAGTDRSQSAGPRSGRRDAVAAALDYLVRRGDVGICDAPAARGCGTACRRCPIGAGTTEAGGPVSAGGSSENASRSPIVYQWIERPSAVLPGAPYQLSSRQPRR